MWTPILALLAFQEPAPPPRLCEGVVPDAPFTGADREPRPVRIPFPASRVLPEPPAELFRSGDPIHLIEEVRQALAADYTSGRFGGEALGLASFGDVLRRLADAPDGPRVELARLARDAPRIHGELAWWLPALLSDEGLSHPDWEAKDGAPEDGFYCPTEWELPPSSIDAAAWPRARGETIRACEVATLAFLGRETTACAALSAMLAVERHLARYPEWKGTWRRYAGAELVGDGIERAADGSHLAWRVAIDLKGFGAPTIRVTRRDRFLPDGTFVSETWSDSKPFALLMGRTSYLPVRDSSGRFVALLVVGALATERPEWLPRSMLREQLGNMKLRAEGGR